MQRSQRLDEIERLINSNGHYRVADLAAVTGASEVSIRRDLSDLEGMGRIERIRGGARPTSASRHQGFEMTLRRHESELVALADAVAADIPDGVTVLIDGSPLGVLVAERLRGSELTVIGLSVRVLAALRTSAGVEHAVAPGGEVSADGQWFVGAAAVDAVRTYRPDLAVLGAVQLSVDHGLTVDDPARAAVLRAAVPTASHHVAGLLAEQVHRKHSFAVAPLKSLDIVYLTNIDERLAQATGPMGLVLRNVNDPIAE